MEPTKTSSEASGSTTPIPADSATPAPAQQDAPGTAAPPAWTTHYDSLLTKLPAAISSHIPPSAVAASTVDAVTTRLSAFSSTGTAHLSALGSTGSAQLGELQRNGSKRLESIKNGGKKLGPDQFLKQAYSITNETQVALNVSLNQVRPPLASPRPANLLPKVGPLMYGVLLPNETFARRVRTSSPHSTPYPTHPRPANVWYSIEIRPWTSPSTAYTPWSVTWPILSVAGPVAAATSLLAIPFVALAVGTSVPSFAGAQLILRERWNGAGFVDGLWGVSRFGRGGYVVGSHFHHCDGGFSRCARRLPSGREQDQRTTGGGCEEESGAGARGGARAGREVLEHGDGGGGAAGEGEEEGG